MPQLSLICFKYFKCRATWSAKQANQWVGGALISELPFLQPQEWLTHSQPPVCWGHPTNRATMSKIRTTTCFSSFSLFCNCARKERGCLTHTGLCELWRKPCEKFRLRQGVSCQVCFASRQLILLACSILHQSIWIWTICSSSQIRPLLSEKWRWWIID